MSIFRTIVIALATLSLAGCFKSAAPLITPSTASYPIADGSRFTRLECYEEDDCETVNVVVNIRAGYYVVTETGGDEPVTSRGLLKEIAANTYVAMVIKKQDGYEYVLLVREGASYKRYDWGSADLPLETDCSNFGAAKINDSIDCKFSDFESLKRAFLTILRTDPSGLSLPDESYTMGPDARGSLKAKKQPRRPAAAR
jgi:hypothetical protein